MHFCFEFPKDEFDWPFLLGIFQYLFHISENPHELESFKPLPTYLGIKAPKFATNEVVLLSNPLSPSHKTSLVLQVEVKEAESSSIDVPPSMDELRISVQV